MPTFLPFSLCGVAGWNLKYLPGSRTWNEEPFSCSLMLLKKSQWPFTSTLGFLQLWKDCTCPWGGCTTGKWVVSHCGAWLWRYRNEEAAYICSASWNETESRVCSPCSLVWFSVLETMLKCFIYFFFLRGCSCVASWNFLKIFFFLAAFGCWLFCWPTYWSEIETVLRYGVLQIYCSKTTGFRRNMRMLWVKINWKPRTDKIFYARTWPNLEEI